MQSTACMAIPTESGISRSNSSSVELSLEDIASRSAVARRPFSAARAGARSRGLGGQRFDQTPVFLIHGCRRCEPRAAGTQHVRQVEVRLHRVLRDAARRAKASVRKRTAQAIEHRNSTGSARRKELEVTVTRGEPG